MLLSYKNEQQLRLEVRRVGDSEMSLACAADGTGDDTPYVLRRVEWLNA